MGWTPSIPPTTGARSAGARIGPTPPIPAAITSRTLPRGTSRAMTGGSGAAAPPSDPADDAPSIEAVVVVFHRARRGLRSGARSPGSCAGERGEREDEALIDVGHHALRERREALADDLEPHWRSSARDRDIGR